MSMRRTLFLTLSHLVAGAIGFAAGIYALPILTAPPAPSEQEVSAAQSTAVYSAEFRRDLEDSDAFHWGEGKVAIAPDSISLKGKLAPGPDYRLYLSPEFVETESRFKDLKAQMIQVGDVKTFNGFVVKMPPDVDPSRYNTVIVWCESFGQFITSAQYQP